MSLNIDTKRIRSRKFSGSTSSASDEHRQTNRVKTTTNVQKKKKKPCLFTRQIQLRFHDRTAGPTQTATGLNFVHSVLITKMRIAPIIKCQIHVISGDVFGFMLWRQAQTCDVTQHELQHRKSFGPSWNAHSEFATWELRHDTTTSSKKAALSTQLHFFTQLHHQRVKTPRFKTKPNSSARFP